MKIRHWLPIGMAETACGLKVAEAFRAYDSAQEYNVGGEQVTRILEIVTCDSCIDWLLDFLVARRADKNYQTQR